MQSKVNQFIGKAFRKDGKIYIVEDALVKEMKAIIRTDKRVFVMYESELNDLMAIIEFCNVPETVQTVVVAHSMIKNNVLTHQVVQQNELSSRICKKLEEVFDELTGAPGEETYKKAKSMVEVANSIVGVQMANYKYLTLNNR